MVEKDNRGFTVTEVMIFLAISGILIFIAIASTGTAISNTRFTDAMRSTQSYVQRQYSDVLNGLNLRSNTVACNATSITDSSPGVGNEVGQSPCLLLGRLVTWQNGVSPNAPESERKIVVYPVVGMEPAMAITGLNDDQLLQKYNMRIVDVAGTTDEFVLPWGTSVAKSCANIDASTITTSQVLGKCVNPKQAVDGYLIIRSPRSGEIKTFVFDNAWGLSKGNKIENASAGGPGYMNFTSGTGLDKYRQQTNICFQSADRMGLYGGLQVGGQIAAGQISMASVSDLDATEAKAVCNV